MELNVAEQTVYEALCSVGSKASSREILRALGETSLDAVAVHRILHSLQDKCLIVGEDSNGWMRTVYWRPLSPVEIVAEKKAQKRWQQHNEANRQLTAQEKNALVIAKRKGLA